MNPDLPKGAQLDLYTEKTGVVCNAGGKGNPMDIWTERLERRDLPTLKYWIGRTSGQLTPCDLPDNPDALPQWYKKCTAEPGRMDCLVLAYETPIGIAGFQRASGQPSMAEFYLMLGEANYNLIRTATYATLRILDRAFHNYTLVNAKVYGHHKDYLSVLMRMGFTQISEEGGLVAVNVDKETFQSRKYLF